MRQARASFVLVALLCGISLAPAPAFGDKTFDYAPFARVLREYVTEQGYVRYTELQTNRADLDAFCAQLAETSPENSPELFPTREDQLAYWINAYNAIVMKAVLDRYPIESVGDASYLFGFFWKLQFAVGGRQRTLNEIEHGILRPRFRDPRVHFAINCASESCPRLTREPFLPQTLHEQLDAAARAFLGEARNVRPEPQRNLLHLSMIFNWFLDDFRNYVRETQNKRYPSVLDFIQLYASPELKSYIENQKPAIRYIDYDWSLNDARN